MVPIWSPGRLWHVARHVFARVKRHVRLLEHQFWVQSRKTKRHLLIRASVQNAFQKKVGRNA